jgi:hypothetical protein
MRCLRLARRLGPAFVWLKTAINKHFGTFARWVESKPQPTAKTLADLHSEQNPLSHPGAFMTLVKRGS